MRKTVNFVENLLQWILTGNCADVRNGELGKKEASIM